MRGDSLSPRYLVLPAVVEQGRALRLLYPGLDSVAFVDHWTADYRDFDLFVTGADGAIRGLGRGLDAQVALASQLLAIRFDATAREQLEAAVPLWPDDPRLRFAYAVALGRRGSGGGDPAIRGTGAPCPLRHAGGGGAPAARPGAAVRRRAGRLAHSRGASACQPFMATNGISGIRARDS